MTIDLAKLSAPFPPEKIDWRVGATTGDKKKGMALAYIDARDVMQRLDEVCGPGGWQCRYSHADTKTICEIGINILMCGGEDNDHGPACFEWVWKADGAGDTDFEAEKGAISTAFKRAAVKWGIGRYLYDVAAPWVEIEARGKSFSIKQGEYAKLRAALGSKTPSAPQPPAPKANGAAAPAKTNGKVDPVAWWASASLTIPVKEKNWQEWDKRMYAAINAAPDFEKLMKLQMDNADNLDGYFSAHPDAHKNLMGAFATRAGNLSQEPAA